MGLEGWGPVDCDDAGAVRICEDDGHGDGGTAGEWCTDVECVLSFVLVVASLLLHKGPSRCIPRQEAHPPRLRQKQYSRPKTPKANAPTKLALVPPRDALRDHASA